MLSPSQITFRVRALRVASLLSLLLICFALNVSFIAHAQVQATGSISGTVQDPSGGVLAGVQVTASNPATGLTRETTTDEEGRYSIPVLPAGTY